MRKMDYWLGLPICFFLSVVHFLSQFFKPRVPMAEPSKILFVQFSEMGSIVCAYPVFNNIQKKHPSAELFFLTFFKNQDCIHILNVLPEQNILSIRTSRSITFFWDTLRCLWKIRFLRVDIVFDFELFSRFSAILSYLSGAQKRVGFHRFTMEGLYRGDLFTHKIQYNVYQHIGQNFLSFLNCLDESKKDTPRISLKNKTTAPSKPDFPILISSPKELSLLWEKLKTLAPALTKDHLIVLLNISGGILPIRAWPLNHYVTLSKHLLSLERTFIILIGEADAQPENEILLNAFSDRSRILNFAGKTSLQDLLTLYELATFLISNDSGPAHFASLKPTLKTFVLFGPETPELYAPLGKHFTIFYERIGCSPCVSAFNHRNTLCKNNVCLQAISPESVFSAVKTALLNI